MSKFSRDKGVRRERDAVNRFKKWGLHAERNITQVRDGGHDIDLYIPKREILIIPSMGMVERGAPAIGEVKAHAKLPITQIREWLSDNDWLLLDEDRKDRLYVVPERIFRELVE